MKNKMTSLLFVFMAAITIFILIIIITNPKEKVIIKDIISVVSLKAGQTDTIQISDLFYASNYEIIFDKHENIDIDYLKNQLILTAHQDYTGFTNINFELSGLKYSFPVTVKPTEKVKFIYKTKDDVKNVFLFGNFNNWNRSELPMKMISKGVYEIEHILEPGNYQYKFFVDGNEIIDFNNPIKVPNGLGDFNSVISISAPNNQSSYLHRKDITTFGGTTKFTFFYETISGKISNNIKILAFLDNSIIDKEQITKAGNIIEISIPNKKLIGINNLRLGITDNKYVTNIQDIKLYNGLLVTNADNYFPWYNSIIYSLLVDRFNDGNKDINKLVKHDSLDLKVNYMGGDFKGITNKINEGYFTDLGINTIWLSPVYDNPNEAFKEYPAPHRWFSGYHGYWPISSEDVEEKFGSLDDLKELIKIAHTKNIKVILDFVSNHVHQDHPFYKNNKNWFGKLELPDGRLNLRLWDEHRLTTWFEPYLPSFDYIKSKEALEEVTDNALWWLKETNADGFRHDAVKHVPNVFWRRLTEKLKSDSKLKNNKYFQIGETFGNYELIKSYVNNGQLDSQFNFELFNNAVYTFLTPDADFTNLSNEVKRTIEHFGVPNLMGNLMDSHDKDRFISYAEKDLAIGDQNSIKIGWENPPRVDNPESYKYSELYKAYLMTIPGIPVIYYGSEFGMPGAADPDNRRMMKFGNELNINEKELLNNISKLVHLRKNNDALVFGDFYTVKANKDCFVYIRNNFNNIILVVLNKGNKQKIQIILPDNKEYFSATDLLTNEVISVNFNEINFEVNSKGYRIFKLK